MATCNELATQLDGLQNQLSGQQNQLSGLQSQLSDLEYQRTHPNEACADQGLTGTDCQLYLKRLGPQIRSTQSQISGVQSQISGIQAQITNVQRQQQVHWCFPVLGADGTPLTITSDEQGSVTAAEAVGTDGVKRRFTRTSAFPQNKQGWYYGVMRQEFFENEQRYLYVTSWIYLWGRKVSVSMSGGGKDYGFSINFPDDGSHDSTPITIASGAMGQQFTVTQGTLNLNQGSISAPSITANFALPPEIAQQFIKIAYFQQLFDRENEQTAAQSASDLQAAGVDPNMTLNQALYGQGAGQAAMILRPFAGAGGHTFTKNEAKAACVIGGALLGFSANMVVSGALGLLEIPGGDVVGKLAGALTGAYSAIECNNYVDAHWDQSNPPAPPPDNPDMGSMPPDASVQMDDGSPWDGGSPSDGGESGGSPSGICIQGEAPQQSRQGVIVPFEQTVSDCL